MWRSRRRCIGLAAASLVQYLWVNVPQSIRSQIVEEHWRCRWETRGHILADDTLVSLFIALSCHAIPLRKPYHS